MAPAPWRRRAGRLLRAADGVAAARARPRHARLPQRQARDEIGSRRDDSQRGRTTRVHQMMNPVTNSVGGASPRTLHAILIGHPPKLPTWSGAAHRMMMSPAVRRTSGGFG